MTAVIKKAFTPCFNNGQRVEDHFVEITEMIEIGKGDRHNLGFNPIEFDGIRKQAGLNSFIKKAPL